MDKCPTCKTSRGMAVTLVSTMEEGVMHCMVCGKDFKDCFGFYDDGNKQCEACPNDDACFKKGVI